MGAIRSVSHGFSPQWCVAACAAARPFDGPSMHLINDGVVGGWLLVVGGEGRDQDQLYRGWRATSSPQRLIHLSAQHRFLPQINGVYLDR